MKDVRFERRTPFSVVTTLIHRGTATASAYVELTLASGSIRLTFRDATALQVFANAFSELSYAALEDPRLSAAPAIRSRVFSRDNPDGEPHSLRRQLDLF